MSGTRTALSVLAFLVFLVPIGAVTGQHQGHGAIGSEDNTVKYDDKATDVKVAAAAKLTGQNQDGSQVPSNLDHIDILNVEFGSETEKQFVVKLGLKSLTNSNPPGAGWPSRSLSFHYGRIPWQIFMGPCNQRLENAGEKACLRYGDSARGMRPVKEFTYTKDGQTAVFTIEKVWMFNENRVPPRFGAHLQNLSAQATHYYGGIPFPLPVVGADPSGGVYAFDTAPDEGKKHDKHFIFNKGSNAHGHLALTSVDPIRVSNGEATTIVYKVEALNHHVEALTINLEPKGIPPGWSVRTPALIELEPQSTTVLPVILSVPFTHDHGKTFTFDVHAQALEDAGSYADVTLGIYWTEIPQPSAHHETDDGGTFFHSATIANERTIDQLEPYVPTYQMWMNGIEKDPDPAVTDKPVPATFNELIGCVFVKNVACPQESVTTWFFPLSPPLLMGLDFDLTRTGRLGYEIMPKVTSPTGKVIMRLLYCDPDTLVGVRNCLGNQTSQGNTGNSGQFGGCPGNYPQLIAEGKKDVSINANTALKDEIEFKISDSKWDLLPYKQGSNIGMCVSLITTVPQNTLFQPQAASPEFVVSTSRLRLPLIEYHDPIDQAFVNVGALDLTTSDPFEKQVNPGETTIFNYELKTNSKEPLDVIVEVQGINRDWVILPGATEFQLLPGQKSAIVVAVAAPADAVSEERAELFLVVQSKQDASIITVNRLRATVVTSPDLEDQASQLTTKEKEDTPGVGPLLLFGVLVGAVWIRRRRA